MRLVGSTGWTEVWVERGCLPPWVVTFEECDINTKLGKGDAEELDGCRRVMEGRWRW